MEEKPTLSFDDDYRVRCLDTAQFNQIQSLETEASEFVTKISDFNGTVRSLVEAMDVEARRIEKEKLRAIGQRNLVDSEHENRTRQQIAMQALINEKEAELERYTQQYESLVQVEAEQAALIEKLSNNEA